MVWYIEQQMRMISSSWEADTTNLLSTMTKLYNKHFLIDPISLKKNFSDPLCNLNFLSLPKEKNRFENYPNTLEIIISEVLVSPTLAKQKRAPAFDSLSQVK